MDANLTQAYFWISLALVVVFGEIIGLGYFLIRWLF